MQRTHNSALMRHVKGIRFRSANRIAPNRVCVNALLAAYARAKPVQWAKVCLTGCVERMASHTSLTFGMDACMTDLADWFDHLCTRPGTGAAGDHVGGGG